MTGLVVLQHLEREGPGLFAAEAQRRSWPIHTARFDRGDPLPQLQPHDLLLVLGGPMGVAHVGDPAYPWLAAAPPFPCRWAIRPGSCGRWASERSAGLCTRIRIRLPPAAELLASSLHCPEQAFRLGERAVGLQFHIELLPELLELWLEHVGDSVRWGAEVAPQGERLIANLFDLLPQSTSWAWRR